MIVSLIILLEKLTACMMLEAQVSQSKQVYLQQIVDQAL
jgi:hypothetical protein